MPTNTIRRFLYSQDIRYARITYSESIDTLYNEGNREIQPHQIARAYILKDFRGLLMAIIPAINQLDITALNLLLHRNLQLADFEDYSGVFHDCEPDSIPALGEAYGLEAIIDEKLLDLDQVYFVSGQAQEFIRISGADFQLIHSNAWYGNTFSHISHRAPSDERSSMQKLIDGIGNLPPMPGMAARILELNSNPHTHAQDLADLIEQDPSLCAQIIRFAQSPFYGYNGKIQSVRQAISRVLGFDLVMNIALGIAMAKPFKMPMNGPLGLKSYWRHATYSAALSHGLCHLMPRRLRPRPGSAYLCGLLHNIGLLVMGHFQQDAYAKLNQEFAIADGSVGLLEMEEQLLSSNHCKIGLMLMEKWQMPDYICASVAHHHNEEYQGVASQLNQITLIADRLLKTHGIGDAQSEQLPQTILENLGLSETQVYSMLDKTINGSKDLDSMANQLAA